MRIEQQELNMLATNETRLKNGSKRQRAKAPKVRTGCITCKTRRVKCDEVKPSCTQCTRGNRECGYQSFTPLPVTTRVLLPKTVAPGPQVDFSAEQPALEFFFLKTAPQLAGFFSHAFFQGSVLQRSFTEPAIRQAIGALGFLHERAAASRRLSESDEQSHSKSGIHIQLYNRSIRSIIQYSQKPDSLPLVIMVSLLFACFELLNNNPNAATAHVKSGIGLLRSWREKTKEQMTPTPESRFLEVDIAPLLHIFDLNLMGRDKENRTNFMLNPIVNGRLRLPTQFEDLDDAKVRLIDIIASAMGHPESTICILDKGQKNDTDTQQTFLLPSNGVEAMGIWSQAFDDLTLRRGHSWGKRERRSGNAVYLTRIALYLSSLVYQVQSECDWDKYRDRYEELIQICEDTLLDCEDLMGYFAQIINIDSGLLFALHFGAWKCRWPKIRQHCLGLFLRVPQREWDYEAKHFYRIFKRVKEKEEEFIPLSLGSDEENCLPPEHVRIHDFAVSQPESLAGSTIYEVSFWTKPDGPQGEWHISIEQMTLDSPRAAHTVMPSNLLPRKVQ